MAQSIHEKLFSYQIKDRDDMIARKTAILAESIGSGKSVIAMSVMDKLWQSGSADKILVAAPNSAIFQWCDMIREWLDIEPYPVLGGFGKEARYHKYEWFKKSLHHPILLVNYNSIRTDMQELVSLGIKACFLDEATAIKGFDSITAMRTRALALTCEYRFPITGTPIQNNLLELYALMAAVEPRVFGDYWGFRHQHVVEQEILIPIIMSDGRRGVRPVKKIVGYRNLEVRKPAIDIYCIRNGVSEVADKLPEVVVENRYVELSPLQKVKYNEISSGILSIGYGVKQVNALERLLRLFECCDSLKLLGDTEDRSNKIDEVINLLEGELSATQTIVFSQFKIPIKSMEKRLNAIGIPVGIIDGDVPLPARAKAQSDFNNGTIRVLLMSTAGEMALNLQGGSCVIMLDRLYNPMRNSQIIGRVARVGQSKKSVVVINIIARGTVDEGVFKVLKRKVRLINDIFQDQDINSLGIEQMKCLVRGEVDGLL